LPTQSIDWSGPSQMSLNVTTVQLAITELSYHPADPNVAESQVDALFSASDFEFIELQNIGSGPIQLEGYAFTNGVDLTLPNAVLEAGQYGVVVSDRRAFEARYGTEKNVLGQYSGKLKNSGERVALADAEGNTLFDFEYGDDDPWPVRADGSGATLELIDPAGTPAGQYGQYYRWRGSTEQGGSPGAAGVGQLGDLDLDGDVDFDDIGDLVLALTDADAYQARYGVSELVSGDLDRNGAVDQVDIDMFVALLRAADKRALRS
ncbi:MAG: lamin tail domain-containing protein, partial [Pirellulales bacterium]